jgi:hypothetical protein
MKQESFEQQKALRNKKHKARKQITNSQSKTATSASRLPSPFDETLPEDSFC